MPAFASRLIDLACGDRLGTSVNLYGAAVPKGVARGPLPWWRAA
jgi:hypothetical protein